MSNVAPLFNSRRPPDLEAAHLRQEAVDSLHRALTGAVDGLRNIPIFLKECFTRKSWQLERILAGGNRQEPIPFHEFVHANYPVGIGATYDTIRGFIAQDVELLAMFDEAARRVDGGQLGNANWSSQQLEYNTTVDNINSRVDDDAKPFEPAPDAPPPRPTGTSAQAALRRLEKAVREGNERAAAQQQDVIAGRISPHRAAVNMGWRKEPTPLETGKRAWLKMTDDEREQFRDWVAEN
jgi:hypothetical protein